MNMGEQSSLIDSRDSLADFVEALRRDLEAHPDEWENRTLSRYLESLSAWIREMDGYYQNCGQMAPTAPSWRNIGEMLLAAKHFE